MPKLTYLGHSGFLVDGVKAKLVIDPFLTGNDLAKHKPGDIKADYVLLTHGHGDHLGDAIGIAKKNNATVITTFELADYCSKKGLTAHGMQIGGGFNFPFGRVKMTIAHHGSMTPDGVYAGNPAGFLITMDEKTLYHAGDTGLFLDMQLIGEMNRIDLALLPIGDNFTMGIDDAVKAAEFLKAKMFIPMHYNTFDIIKANPEDFVEKVKARGFNAQVLNIGGSVDY